MRERKEHPSHISGLLSKTAKKFKFHDDISVYRVWKRWVNIAGETLALHTEPVRLKRGKLVICVEHPAWMQEVGFIKQALLEKIRKDFSYLNIKDISFELGRLNPSKEIPEQKPAYKPTEDEKEFIGQATGEIADPDVRDAARKAMERMFGNRRQDTSKRPMNAGQGSQSCLAPGFNIDYGKDVWKPKVGYFEEAHECGARQSKLPGTGF